MKRALFLFFILCFAVTGCASEKAIPAAKETKKVFSVLKPEVVIRSGRKDPLLKAAYVLEILGMPDVRRYEKPSEVWVYSQEGCVLFVYMQEQTDGSLLVKHMEIGTPTFKSKEKDSMACLREASKLR